MPTSSLKSTSPSGPERVDPAFEPLIRKFGLETLRAQSGAAYGVWPDLRLAYLSPGWYQFAEENGAGGAFGAVWDLGASILDGVPAALRPYYKSGLDDCLTSGRVWGHQYECSSARRYRVFYQRVYPLGDAEGLLIMNSLVVERDHLSSRVAHDPDTAVYVDENGYISQCAHCRLVRNLSELERWDWVPAWVERPHEAISHTLCPHCFAVYYPRR